MKTMMEKSKYFGDSILFFCSLIWGIGYIIVALALQEGVGELFLTASRFTIACLLQLPFVYKKLKHINKTALIKGVILGLLLVLGFLTQVIGQTSTTTTNVAFLTSVNVVLIPFTSFLIIRKKLELRSVIAALITFVGLGFLTLGNTFSINVGDFYVIICAILFAAYASVADLSAKEEETSILVFVQFLTAAVFSSLAFIFSGEPLVLNNASVSYLIYLGVFSNLIATSLYTFGLKYTSAERGSIILSLESLFGALLGIFIFDEPFTFKLVIGSVLIFFAILYSERLILNKPRIAKTD